MKMKINKKPYVELLPKSGRFYKVNLHAHSTLSDGHFTPEELKGLYLANGYSAVAFTDHRNCISHAELTDENFVALTGVELDFHSYGDNGELASAVHLNVIANEQNYEQSFKSMPLEYGLINQTIENLKKAGHFVTLNHPVWSNMSTEELFTVKGYDAMEVFNSIAATFNNFSDDSAFYEVLLRKGGKCLPIAADDCHKIFEDGSPFLEYCKGFTVIKAPELTYKSLFDGLRAGNFYSSTGPKFENLWLEGDVLHVECSPVYGVFVHSKYLTCKTQDIRRTDCITHTEIDISKIRKNSPYFWVQLRDTNGKKAWAVPYWFDRD